VASTLQTVLGPIAARAARATGFVQRTSKLTGARFVQTLVFGWLALSWLLGSSDLLD
jgi:hypothetical protein